MKCLCKDEPFSSTITHVLQVKLPMIFLFQKLWSWEVAFVIIVASALLRNRQIFFLFSWTEGTSNGSEAKEAFWDGKTADSKGMLCLALSQHFYISNQCLNVTELKIASSLTRSNAISHRFLFVLETASSLLSALGCWSDSWFSHASYHLSAKQTLKKCLTVLEMVQ